MSDFGEEILSDDRLNPLSKLSNPNSDGYKLIDNTIGAYLDYLDDNNKTDQLFLSTATDGFLDLIGGEKGVLRLKDEDDESYRLRILNHKNFKFAPQDLKDVGINIFCWVEDVNTQCSSSNIQLSNKYYLDIDNDENEELVDKFINDNVYEILREDDITS